MAPLRSAGDSLDDAKFIALMMLLKPRVVGLAQMPEDILMEIFHIAMTDPSTLTIHAKHRASLMGVCRHWAYLIANTPAFWTYLDFHKVGSMSTYDALLMLHTHFNRSSITYFLNLDLSNFEEGELDLKALHDGVTQRVRGCVGLKLVLATSTQIQHFLPLHPVFSGLSGLWADIGLSGPEPGVNMDASLGRPQATQIEPFRKDFAPVNLNMSIGVSYGVDFGSLNTSRLVSLDIRSQSVTVHSSITAEQLDRVNLSGPGTSRIMSALCSPRLRYLSLESMHFTCDLDVQWIAEAIGRMHCLEVFQLQFMPDVRQAHGIARAIIPKLAQLPVLREIHIWNRHDFYAWRQRFIDTCIREEGAFGRLERVRLDNQEHWPAIVRVAVCMRPHNLPLGSSEGQEQPSAEVPVEDVAPTTSDIVYNEGDVDTDEEEEVYAKLINGTMYQSLPMIGIVH